MGQGSVKKRTKSNPIPGIRLASTDCSLGVWQSLQWMLRLKSNVEQLTRTIFYTPFQTPSSLVCWVRRKHWLRIFVIIHMDLKSSCQGLYRKRRQVKGWVQTGTSYDTLYCCSATLNSYSCRRDSSPAANESKPTTSSSISRKTLDRLTMTTIKLLILTIFSVNCFIGNVGTRLYHYPASFSLSPSTLHQGPYPTTNQLTPPNRQDFHTNGLSRKGRDLYYIHDSRQCMHPCEEVRQAEKPV